MSALQPGASRPMSSRPSAFAPPTVAAWRMSAVDTVSMCSAAIRARTAAVRISSRMLCGDVSVPMPMLTPVRR